MERGLKMDRDQARNIAWVFLAGGITLLAINHWNYADEKSVYLWAILIGPAALLLGLFGLFEPRLLLGLGKYGRDLPIGMRVGSFAIVAAGLAVTAILWIFVYRM